MDDKQTLKLKMYINVKSVCTRNENVWNAIPAINGSFNSLKGNIEKINQINEQTMSSTKGATESKKQLKEQMANKTMVLIGALKAFASVTGNTALAKDAELAISDINLARDTDADDICLAVLKNAKTHLNQLAEYGITQADIDTTDWTISHFTEMIGKPKAAILQTKSNNEQIASLFKATDKILEEQMDALMIRFKTANEVFYSEYLSARRIGGNGSAKKVEDEQAK